MEVKIGVQHAPRELVLETSDSADDVRAALDKALTDHTTLVLRDSRGRVVLVPAESIAYVEIGGGVSGQVGFRG
jgi:DNA-binding transcriptional regulator/RsmH inhibitor MraZ